MAIAILLFLQTVRSPCWSQIQVTKSKEDSDIYRKDFHRVKHVGYEWGFGRSAQH